MPSKMQQIKRARVLFSGAFEKAIWNGQLVCRFPYTPCTCSPTKSPTPVLYFTLRVSQKLGSKLGTNISSHYQYKRQSLQTNATNDKRNPSIVQITRGCAFAWSRYLVQRSGRLVELGVLGGRETEQHLLHVYQELAIGRERLRYDCTIFVHS